MPTFNGPMVNPLKNPAAGIPEDNSLQLAATQTEYPRKKKKRMKSTTGWWFKPSLKPCLKPPTRQAGAFFLKLFKPPN